MKVSLIIPIYNMELYLKECLESAVSQTWKDYEIIIVDDGSIDNSMQICIEYSDKYEKIKLIHQEHEGLVSAWIRGIQQSSGEYIAFLDGDDWIEKDYLENMIKYANESDLICCNYVLEYEKYQIFQAEIIPPRRYEKDEIEKVIFPVLLNDGGYLERGISPHRWAKLILRKQIMNNLHWCNWQISYGEDINIIFPIILNSRSIVIVNDEKGLYHYRQNRVSISRNYIKQMFFQIRQLYTRLMEINRINSEYDFTGQIHRDSFCLFLEYVKNETKCKKGKNNIKVILNNYREWKKDFEGVVQLFINLKLTDKILYLCLENENYLGLIIWMLSYRIAKKLTKNWDWKYGYVYKKRKKNKNSDGWSGCIS